MYPQWCYLLRQRCDHPTQLSTSQASPGVCVQFWLPQFRTDTDCRGSKGEAWRWPKGCRTCSMRKDWSRSVFSPWRREGSGRLHPSMPVLKGQLGRGHSLCLHNTWSHTGKTGGSRYKFVTIRKKFLLWDQLLEQLHMWQSSHHWGFAGCVPRQDAR